MQQPCHFGVVLPDLARNTRQPDHVLSIEDALLHLTTPESLPDFMSSRGVRTQDASKQVFVDALPPVLLLHLKRFLYDEVGGVQKSTKKVAYGTELTIDERVMSAPLRAQVGKDGAKYELFGGKTRDLSIPVLAFIVQTRRRVLTRGGLILQSCTTTACKPPVDITRSLSGARTDLRRGSSWTTPTCAP